MGKLRVYTAGPITGTTYKGCTGWRDYVEKKLTDFFEVLSPMRNKAYLEKEHQIQDHYNQYLSTPDGIMCRDMWDIERCDILLANVLGAQKVSIGTVMEITLAWWLRKPVILAIDNNIHTHAMLSKASNFIVNDLDTAINIIQGLK